MTKEMAEKILKTLEDKYEVDQDFMDEKDKEELRSQITYLKMLMKYGINCDNHKFNLVEVKQVDIGKFQILEGKFHDMEQLEYQHKEVYVYANLSNIGDTFEDSEVRVYPYPFKTLYCAEDYELLNLNEETLEYFKTEILKAKEAGNYEEV